MGIHVLCILAKEVSEYTVNNYMFLKHAYDTMKSLSLLKYLCVEVGHMYY